MKILNLITFLIVFGSASGGRAQSQSVFKRTTATILFASIGGGVLGLSTLSFYGKPQEHTDNITTGVLIGFLAGFSYVMYDTYGLQSSTTEPTYKPFAGSQAAQLVAVSEQKKRDPAVSWPLFSFDYNW